MLPRVPGRYAIIIIVADLTLISYNHCRAGREPCQFWFELPQLEETVGFALEYLAEDQQMFSSMQINKWMQYMEWWSIFEGIKDSLLKAKV